MLGLVVLMQKGLRRRPAAKLEMYSFSHRTWKAGGDGAGVKIGALITNHSRLPGNNWVVKTLRDFKNQDSPH